MKKIILLAALALIPVLAGCSSQQSSASASSTGNTEAQTSAAETTATTAAPVATAVETVAPTTEAASAAQADNGNISLEDAKSIALQDAGFDASQVQFTNTGLDTDDGIEKYEIDFTNGGYEYEYDINAKTGEIIEKSKDTDD